MVVQEGGERCLDALKNHGARLLRDSSSFVRECHTGTNPTFCFFFHSAMMMTKSFTESKILVLGSVLFYHDLRLKKFEFSECPAVKRRYLIVILHSLEYIAK